MPLPAPSGSRIVPRIKATEGQAVCINKIVDRAIARFGQQNNNSDIFKSVFETSAIETVEDAVGRLVSEKVHNVPSPRFRRDLNALLKTLDSVIENFPESDMRPPWYQMRAQFTGGDPFADDLSHDGDDQKETYWRQHLHPRAIRRALKEHHRLIRELLELSKGTKPVQKAERNFVITLARFWRDRLGLPLRLGKGDGHMPRGDFADFVRAAQSLYPTEKLKQSYDPSEHRELMISNLNGHIRTIVEEIRRGDHD
jgi:hypothetical protein